jgi:hypothetical protein
MPRGRATPSERFNALRAVFSALVTRFHHNRKEATALNPIATKQQNTNKYLQTKPNNFQIKHTHKTKQNRNHNPTQKGTHPTNEFPFKLLRINHAFFN